MPLPFPCKNCPDRYIGCHSKCEKYLTAKSNHEKRKAEIRLQREAAVYLQDRIAKNVNNAAKTHRDNRNYKRFRKN